MWANWEMVALVEWLKAFNYNVEKKKHRNDGAF
ncbi:MAG: erythromycin esterase family protein [Bacteroidota bacterium]|nr:erythromycin esterase family protein [Bacteroidota bacterium]